MNLFVSVSSFFDEKIDEADTQVLMVSMQEAKVGPPENQKYKNGYWNVMGCKNT